MDGYKTNRWTRLCGLCGIAVAAALQLAVPSSARGDEAPPATQENANAKPELAPQADDVAEASAKGAHDSEQLAQWVRDLDSDRYSMREAAQKQLAAVGAPAMEQVAEVAATGSLESATRAVNILVGWADSKDPQLTLAALERLAALPNRPAESAMANERLASVRETAAIEAIKKLGGKFDVDRYSIMAGRENPLQVILNHEWKGGVEGLKHIADVRNITLISLWSAPLGDEALPELAKLGHTSRIELYGTNMSADAIDKQLRTALPHVRIDVRGGARLGIRGLVIQEIEPGSAAEKAGLVPNDRITEFAGTPIDDSNGKGFDQLTELISKCKPGDTVDVKVLRAGEVIDKKVTFDRWGDDVRTRMGNSELGQRQMPMRIQRAGGQIFIQQGGQVIPVQPGQPIQLQNVPIPAQQRR